ASANPKQVTVATTAAKPPPGAAALVSGAPAGPIGPATPLAPRTTGAPGGKLTVSGIAPSASGPPVAPAPAATEGDESPAAIQKRRRTCSQDAAAKGVQTFEMQDYVAVCVGEARLACLKQAVAQKVRGPGRRDFMNRCLLGS